MLSLNTEYAGMSLRNPIIVGSSGLTNSADKNKELEKAGAGAVVIKSLFEEQIAAISNKMLIGSDYPEAVDYIRHYVEDSQVNDYLRLIQASRSACSIPVIASINCYTADTWVDFASQMEKAGASAIELNLFFISSNPQKQDPLEVRYVEILRKVKERTSIPIIVKISKYCSNIPYLVQQLYNNGASAVVLFNKFFQPDINVYSLSVTSGQVFSEEGAFFDTLRWTGIVSGAVPQMNLSASTGVHDWEDIVKCILAGATTVQLCSAIYKYGPSLLTKVVSEIKEWMESMDFQSPDDFRGKLNSSHLPDSTLYERVQFMKYFSNRDE